MNDREVFKRAYEDRDDAACIAEARVRELEEAIAAHRDASEFMRQTIWDGDKSVPHLPHNVALWSLLNKS